MLEVENFLVAETVGKKVVYSIPCSEATYSIDEGTQTRLEITKVTNGPQAVPCGLDAMTIIDGSLDIIKGGLAIGMIVAPPPANVVCGVLAGLGALVQAGLKFFDNKPDPVKEKMKELLKRIDELDKKTMERFVDFKSFITEHKFAVEIISQMTTLKRYMHDCLTDLTPESIVASQNVYRQNPPLNMTYTLMSLMDQKSTNPLIMAMANEKVKTTTTFKKWENIIRAILGDLLLIEAFAAGLLKDRNLYDCERLSEQSYELYDMISIWENEFKMDQSYWDEVKSQLGSWVGECSQLSNEKKADFIEKKMATYLTSDNFYIFVFDHCEWEKDYTYRCKNENKQIIGWWNTTGVNAFIYRSHTSHQKTDEDYKKLTEKVYACRDGKLQYSSKWKKEEKIWLTDRHLYSEYGFVALIYDKKNLHSRYIEQGREPGRYTHSKMVDVTNDDQYTYWLYAAFE